MTMMATTPVDGKIPSKILFGSFNANDRVPWYVCACSIWYVGPTKFDDHILTLTYFVAISNLFLMHFGRHN